MHRASEFDGAVSIYLAVEPLKPLGAMALVIARGDAATDGLATAAVLTGSGRTWIKPDVTKRA